MPPTPIYPVDRAAELFVQQNSMPDRPAAAVLARELLAAALAENFWRHQPRAVILHLGRLTEDERTAAAEANHWLTQSSLSGNEYRPGDATAPAASDAIARWRASSRRLGRFLAEVEADLPEPTAGDVAEVLKRAKARLDHLKLPV